jgi:hypothetical protein
LRRPGACRIIGPAVPRDPERPPDLPRLRSAALRLKHDLGKYIRLSAPARREESTQELRRRLEDDLLRTRSGPSGPMSAPKVFDAWRAKEGEDFSASSELASRVAAISLAIEEIRGLLPRMAGLSREDLIRLDEAALGVAEGCQALHRAAVEEKE